MARKRIKNKKISQFVGSLEFLQTKLDNFNNWEIGSPDYLKTKWGLEVIKVYMTEERADLEKEILKKKRELHALHGRGSGSARRAESVRRAKLARTIDQTLVRVKYPHLTSLRARAAKVRELWPQDEDETPRPSLTFIREHIGKISRPSVISRQREHSDLEGGSPMPRRKTPATPDAVPDQLPAGGALKTARQSDDLIASLRKAFARRARNAEKDRLL
jgi:hypothetical protein